MEAIQSLGIAPRVKVVFCQYVNHTQSQRMVDGVIQGSVRDKAAARTRMVSASTLDGESLASVAVLATAASMLNGALACPQAIWAAQPGSLGGGGQVP